MKKRAVPDRHFDYWPNPKRGDSIERFNGIRTTTAYRCKPVHEGTVRYRVILYPMSSVVATLTQNTKD